MQHDLIIKNGNMIDGTGSDSFSADIAVKDGIITEIGQIEGEAAEIIDAEGMTVSPGFVDIHTHLDAQIGWDPDPCLLYTSPSPRDKRQSRMPSSA